MKQTAGDADRDLTVAVLAGGVGAARFLGGLVQVVNPTNVTAIVNTADDTVMHGLSISPDLDTIVYTLAHAIDPERGWGLNGETWVAMNALDRFAAVRPAGSRAGERWFNLGDQDLATHFYRTTRLREGATLTQVSAEIAAAWAVPITVLPMTDDLIRTVITLADDSRTEVAFQDYFVRLRHDVPVSDISFAQDGARLTDSAYEALETADVIVIAPSNPLVSIGPIRSLPGVDDLLARRRESVVAISPLVGGAALKGPADRMLIELGFESSVSGIADLYAPIASTLVIDEVDAHQTQSVISSGMRCIVHPSVMSTPERARSLAEATLDAVR